MATAKEPKEKTVEELILEGAQLEGELTKKKRRLEEIKKAVRDLGVGTHEGDGGAEALVSLGTPSFRAFDVGSEKDAALSKVPGSAAFFIVSEVRKPVAKTAEKIVDAEGKRKLNQVMKALGVKKPSLSVKLKLTE